MTEGSYLRNSWRPSFQDIWLAGSESGSAGPLGTTSNRFVDNSARANAPKMCCIEKQSSLWSRLGSKWQISNLRCSDSASVFLSPGLWSLPVLSFWCLALQARKRPQEGRLSNKQKSVAVDWQRRRSHLSCLRAYSSILIRLTRSCFILSWPFLSPCRNATWACKRTQNAKEQK